MDFVVQATDLPSVSHAFLRPLEGAGVSHPGGTGLRAIYYLVVPSWDAPSALLQVDLVRGSTETLLPSGLLPFFPLFVSRVPCPLNSTNQKGMPVFFLPWRSTEHLSCGSQPSGSAF